MRLRALTLVTLLLAACAAAFAAPPKPTAAPAALHASDDPVRPITLTDAEWRKRLSPGAYAVLRQAATETAFTGRYWNEHRKGVFVCAGCGLPLFSSATKFDSGTGWPSFWQPLNPTHVIERGDHSVGMDRTEVLCARCGGHLGHVFDDGPPPTGLRYCMNSAALVFRPAK